MIIPAKFQCRECEGDGNIVAVGTSGKEWLIPCPVCLGDGLNEEGFEQKIKQDEIDRKDKITAEKYSAAMEETRKQRKFQS